MPFNVGYAGNSAQVWLPPPPPPPPPPVAQNYQAGDGSFSDQVKGTAADVANDQLFAMMANGAYAPDSPEYAQVLEEAGWSKLEAHADGLSLTDQHGNRIPIDPGLLQDDRSGFSADIYQHEDGHYVIAYRGSEMGTEQSQLMDWVNNGQQGLGMDSAQYSSAIELANRAQHVFGEGNLALTGHSLGGGLASAASLATGASAVTFNASGLSNETLKDLGFSPNAARAEMAETGQVRRYAVNGDPLTLAQEDAPLLPLVGSPPEAIGAPLRIDAPPGTGFLDRHGGGGDNASYVEAFDHAAPYDPSDRPSLSEQLGDQVNNGIDGFGETAGQRLDQAGQALRDNWLLSGPQGLVTGWALSGAGVVVEHVSDVVGDVVGAGITFAGETAHAGLDALGDLQFNTLSSAIREGLDLGGDLGGTLSELGQGLVESGRDLMQGNVLEAAYGAFGDIADAGIDTVGDIVDGAISFTGGVVENGAGAVGGFLRDVGENTGWNALADVAGTIEGAGEIVGDIADAAGGFIDGAADKLGDGVEAVADFAGGITQGVSNFFSGRW